MTGFSAALWTEGLKARRSKVPLLTALGFSLAPLVGGLFMIILKDPEAARNVGLLGAKAQLMAGVADWPTYFNLVAQAVAIGGALLFAIITIWVFGREFVDQTAKGLLALPTARETIVGAKFMVVALWGIALTLLVFGIGLLVGMLVDIPGWSLLLAQHAFIDVMGTALLTLALMPFVALWASIGRGYLPPFGWAILTLAFANITAYIGWGHWFPWAVPALFSGAAGPRVDQLGLHSYLLVIATLVAGLFCTLLWWRRADQA